MTKAYIDIQLNKSERAAPTIYAIYRQVGSLLTGAQFLRYPKTDSNWIRLRFEGDAGQIETCRDWLPTLSLPIEPVNTPGIREVDIIDVLLMLRDIRGGLCRELGLTEVAEYLDESENLDDDNQLEVERLRLAIQQLEDLRSRLPKS